MPSPLTCAVSQRTNCDTAERCPSSGALSGLRHRRRASFTLIELLVVVAILAMLASVGIIQLLRARIVTHEQLALTSIRLIGKSCQFYYLANGGTYPPGLTTLGPTGSSPPYLDAALGQDPATKQGYTFTYTPAGGSFTLLADPERPGVTGVRHFYTDQTLLIHANDSAPAGTSDPVIP